MYYGCYSKTPEVLNPESGGTPNTGGTPGFTHSHPQGSDTACPICRKVPAPVEIPQEILRLQEALIKETERRQRWEENYLLARDKAYFYEKKLQEAVTEGERLSGICQQQAKRVEELEKLAVAQDATLQLLRRREAGI